MKMIRKFLCITCVVALALCAMLVSERADFECGANAMASQTAVRAPRALREDVLPSDGFWEDSGETDEEWLQGWERALAIDEGDVNLSFADASEDEMFFDFDFGDIDWNGFDMDMDMDMEVVSA